MKKYIQRVNMQRICAYLLLISIFLNLVINPLHVVMAGYKNEPGVSPDSVPEGYDEETWERLNDHVLEYDELAARIMEFNPNMISADGAFQAAMSDISDQARNAYIRSRGL